MRKTIVCLTAMVILAACRKNLPDNLTKPVMAASTGSLSTLSLVTDQNPFKVMSFNVRNTDSNDVFTQQQRKGYILQVILDNDPDIVGLQEIAEDSIERYFNAQLAAAGYGVFKSGFANYSPKSIWYK
ncbi:MAG TPA: hypothetical protein VLD19_14120, partial [Chitinophagaceae bacterium]|nr:hypothetical protein [Chitinophagaceae bacterium]